MRSSTCIWAIALALVSGCGGSTGSSGSDATGADAIEDVVLDSSEEDGGGSEDCPAFCDDGLGCTDDSCVDGACVYTVTFGSCLIDESCFEHLELHPSDICLLCSVEVSTTSWSAVPQDLVCDDGDVCTLADQCADGLCVGTPKACDDGNFCTDDACEGIEEATCVHENNVEFCDDGDDCTVVDVCADGGCVGGESPCVDDDACTTELCSDGECSFPSMNCDDNNPCTQDSCNSVNGCFFEVMEGVDCEAGNLCLSGDFCAGTGECVEGVISVTCDIDPNQCTESQCVPSMGCADVFTDAPCDDGLSCTTNDVCIATLCLGLEQDACEPCSLPESFGIMQKATTLHFGNGGQPGEGMDLDGNPATCAPQPGCSGGIDNELGVIAALVNPNIDNALALGVLAPLIEMEGFNTEGDPFSLAVITGAQATGVFGTPSCDPQVEVCDYLVDLTSYGPDCGPTFLVDNAVVEGDKLTGGGPDSVLVMILPVGGKPAYLHLVGGRLEVTLSFGPDGELVGMDGLVAGSVPKQSLLNTVATVDPEYLLGGLPPGTDPADATAEIVALIDALLVEDIDLDLDGVPDAVSAGFRIKTIGGNVTGAVE